MRTGRGKWWKTRMDTFAADGTEVRLEPLVLVDVLHQLSLEGEGLGALRALVRPVVLVGPLVALQVAGLLKHLKY